MGITRMIYVGAYVRFNVPVTTKSTNLCSHQPPKTVSGYCGVCGQDLSHRYVQCRVPQFDPHPVLGVDVMTGFHTDHLSEERHFLVCNRTISTFGSFIERDTVACVNLASLSPDMDAFEKHCGLKKLPVPYVTALGVLAWFL